MKWRPIKTAPKQTKILGFIPSDYGTEVVWHDLSEWCCYRGDGVKPTHWMPLPEPPTVTSPERER